MSSRTTTIIAAIAAAAAVLLVWFSIRDAGAETMTVFRVTKDRDIGDLVSGGVQSVEIETGDRERARRLFPGPQHKGWLESTPLVRAVKAGDLIRFDDLESASRTQLFKDVPEGKRLISITVQNYHAVGFLVRPGDLVDVLISTTAVSEAAGVRSQELIGRTILQAVRVRAVDNRFLASDASLPSASYNTVTLEVTPEQAERIVVYRNLTNDGFTLSLRPPGDEAIVDIAPERVSMR